MGCPSATLVTVRPQSPPTKTALLEAASVPAPLARLLVYGTAQWSQLLPFQRAELSE